MIAACVRLGVIACALLAGDTRADERALVGRQLAGASDPTRIIDVAGVKREYELFVPAGAQKDAALVVVLHGRLGAAKQVRRDSGMDEEATRYGFVALYPQGIDRKWNDLRQVTLKEHAAFGTQDVEFLLALVDTLAASHTIDPKRVFFVGHSNGAIMTLTMACTHADRIAGIAVIAGNLPRTECKLARAVPAIFFHGTADPLVKFEGGGVGPNGARGFVLSNDETVATFARASGCGAMTRGAPVHDSATNTDAVREDRAGCAVPLVRYVIEKGGHGWPGRGPLWRDNTKAVDATSEIARFFFARPTQ